MYPIRFDPSIAPYPPEGATQETERYSNLRGMGSGLKCRTKGGVLVPGHLNMMRRRPRRRAGRTALLIEAAANLNLAQDARANGLSGELPSAVRRATIRHSNRIA
jgi:hypothetical protein